MVKGGVAEIIVAESGVAEIGVAESDGRDSRHGAIGLTTRDSSSLESSSYSSRKLMSCRSTCWYSVEELLNPSGNLGGAALPLSDRILFDSDGESMSYPNRRAWSR